MTENPLVPEMEIKPHNVASSNSDSFKEEGKNMKDNNSNNFLQDIKKSIDELSCIYDEIMGKKKDLKEDMKGMAGDFAESVSAMRKKLEDAISHCDKCTAEENIESQSKSDKSQEGASMMSMIQERIDSIKPYFEKFIESVKNPKGNIGDELDIAALKIKIAAIYAKIFIRKKAHEMMEKFESK